LHVVTSVSKALLIYFSAINYRLVAFTKITIVISNISRIKLKLGN